MGAISAHISSSVEYGTQINAVLEERIKSITQRLDREIRSLEKRVSPDTINILKLKRDRCIKSIKNDVKKLFRRNLTLNDFQDRVNNMKCNFLDYSLRSHNRQPLIVLSGGDNTITVKWNKEVY